MTGAEGADTIRARSAAPLGQTGGAADRPGTDRPGTARQPFSIPEVSIT